MINILLLQCMLANGYSYALLDPKALRTLMLVYDILHSPFYRWKFTFELNEYIFVSIAPLSQQCIFVISTIGETEFRKIGYGN